MMSAEREPELEVPTEVPHQIAVEVPDAGTALLRAREQQAPAERRARNRGRIPFRLLVSLTALVAVVALVGMELLNAILTGCSGCYYRSAITSAVDSSLVIGGIAVACVVASYFSDDLTKTFATVVVYFVATTLVTPLAGIGVSIADLASSCGTADLQTPIVLLTSSALRLALVCTLIGAGARLYWSGSDSPLTEAIRIALPTVAFSDLRTAQPTAVDEHACTICYADYQANDQLTYLPCRHHYHKECIEHWFTMHDTCPMCRQVPGAPAAH